MSMESKENKKSNALFLKSAFGMFSGMFGFYAAAIFSRESEILIGLLASVSLLLFFLSIIELIIATFIPEEKQ